jgi:hypothetical protein
MTFLKMPDGSVVHVRMAKPRARRCKVCERLTAPDRLRECDFKLPDGSTCDLLMCCACAHRTGPDQDLCPEHRWTEIDDLFDRSSWPPERYP